MFIHVDIYIYIYCYIQVYAYIYLYMLLGCLAGVLLILLRRSVDKDGLVYRARLAEGASRSGKLV